MQDLNKLLNIIGLVINIAGALLMFINTPRVNFQVYLYNREEGPLLRDKEKRMNKRIKQGMLLLFIGFFLQLIAIFL